MRVFNQHDGQPSHSTTPFFNFRARVGIATRHFDEPTAFKFFARRKPVQWAIIFWLHLHIGSNQFLVAIITSTYCTAKFIAVPLNVAEVIEGEPDKLGDPVNVCV